MFDQPVRTLTPTRAVHGFTIVEVVIAMTLLVVGALAVVAASAAAVRAVGSAESELAALATAQRRLEELAARSCLAAENGTATDTSVGVRESWRVAVSRNGARLVTDSVEYLDHGILRSIVRGRLVVC
jgi:prepilin-type N-terminal cleavage/methylation domain-containing protein